MIKTKALEQEALKELKGLLKSKNKRLKLDTAINILEILNQQKQDKKDNQPIGY